MTNDKPIRIYQNMESFLPYFYNSRGATRKKNIFILLWLLEWLTKLNSTCMTTNRERGLYMYATLLLHAAPSIYHSMTNDDVAISLMTLPW